MTIQDASATNSGAATSFDGSSNVAIRLPSTIKANITGNVTGSSGSCTGTAAYATKLGDGTASYTYQQIKNAFVCPFPVGVCYIQFPLQTATSSLWAGTTWVELALGGAFLRATGGNAREFGSQTSATGGIQPQGEGVPNLYGEFGTARSDDDYKNLCNGVFSKTDDSYEDGDTGTTRFKQTKLGGVIFGMLEKGTL